MPERITAISAHPAPSVAAARTGHHRAALVFIHGSPALRTVTDSLLHACVVKQPSYVFLAGNSLVTERPAREADLVVTNGALHRDSALFDALYHSQTVREGAEDLLFILRHL